MITSVAKGCLNTGRMVAGGNQCIGKDCAWWLPYANGCALPVVAEILADSTICQNVFEAAARQWTDVKTPNEAQHAVVKEDELLQQLREEAEVVELQVYLNQYRQALYQLNQFVQQNTLGTLMLSEAVGLSGDAPYGGLDLYLIPKDPSLAWSTSSSQQTCSTSGSAQSMYSQQTSRYLGLTGPSWSTLASDLSSSTSVATLDGARRI